MLEVYLDLGSIKSLQYINCMLIIFRQNAKQGLEYTINIHSHLCPCPAYINYTGKSLN